METAPVGVGRHFVCLPGGRWRLWSDIVVRGAGFPASLVRAFDCESASREADRYIGARVDVIRHRQAALREINDRLRRADAAERPALRALRRKLQQGHVRHDGATAQEASLRNALAARASAYAALAQACETDLAAVAAAAGGIVQDAYFREAVVWQNRHVLPIVSARLRDGRGSPADRRSALEWAALTVQRYAVKNDTIGFYGPVAWGSLGRTRDIVDCRPGSSLIARRLRGFEWWCLEALLDRVNTDPALRPWVAPRLRNGVWRHGEDVYLPLTGKATLTDAERAVVDACDGATAARDIATRLGVLAQVDPVEAYALMTGLVERGVLEWRLEVAQTAHPERDLASRIARLGDDTLRARCGSVVEPVLEAFERLLDADGAGPVDEAMADLEQAFAAVTQRRARRRDGHVYAARGLVYEDCARDCELALGDEFVTRLGEPLELVLTAARWASAEWKREINYYLRECHAHLAALRSSREVDAHRLLSHVLAAYEQRLVPIAAAVSERYCERWQSALQVDQREARVTYATADVRPRIDAAFVTDEDGSWAGYISPDVMVAASGLDGFRRGNFRCVLGEVHGGNSSLWRALTASSANHDALSAALVSDTSDRAVLVRHATSDSRLARMDTFVVPTFWRYEFGTGLPDRAAGRSLPAARLIAVVEDGTVRLRARDNGLIVDAYELFAHTFNPVLSGILPKVVAASRHTPRITIGDLTICREAWQCPADDLAFLHEPDRWVRFAKARAWAHSCGMPRYVFCRYPHERKPTYLDFDSLVYVDLFVRMASKLGAGETLSLVEMLPGLEDTWLCDAEGRRYTCELRLVARPCDVRCRSG